MIRVASYNIRKAIGTDRLRRPERILSVIDEVGADIIALQEADRRFGARKSALPPELLDNHGELRPVQFGTGQEGIGWHGNAMLVRSHIKILDCRPLVIPSLEPRGAVLVECRVGKQDLRIVGMHLDLSGLWRKRQVRAILDAVLQRPEKMPTILMGDCNEWRNRGGCLHDFAERHQLVDTGHSFHSRRPVARLDRIFASPDLQAVDAGVHQSALAARASDHLPIWARFKAR